MTAKTILRSVPWITVYLLSSLNLAFCQKQEAALKDRLNFRLEGETRVSGQDLVNTITQLGQRLSVPFGLEVIQGEDLRIPFSRTWNGATVQQVIEDIVSAYPAYTVRYDSGAVEIRPKRNFQEKGALILDVQVDAFSARNEIVAQVSQRLHGLAHYVFTEQKVPPNTGSAGSLGIGAGGSTAVSFALKPGPIRAILNALVAEANQIWIVAYPEEPKITNGYLETVYVNVKKGADSGERQPIWLLLPLRNRDRDKSRLTPLAIG